MQHTRSCLLIVSLLVGIGLFSAASAQGQSSPSKESTPTEHPAANTPAATERYTLPDDPTIPKKFDSPVAFEKWLAEIEKLYIPPKWSEKPKLSDEQRKDLETQREAAWQKADESKSTEEIQTRIEAVLQLDRRLHGSDSERVLNLLQIAAKIYENEGAWNFAESTRQRISELTTRVFGPQSYQLEDARQAIAHLKLLQKMTAAERQQLWAAYQASKQVLELLGQGKGQGKYSVTIPLAQSVLDTRIKLLGPDHPDTATSMGRLAMLYDNKGDYARAEPHYTRALKILEKALGPDHPVTAQSLNYLAMLYSYMGDYARAEPLSIRALKIKEEALGPDHPDTAMCLNNLAALYCKMGYYVRAEPLLTRALKINEKLFGPDHPDTAMCLNNLARLYDKMSDYARAEPLSTRALKINENFGPDHPRTATSLGNLAGLYESMGDYVRAEPLYTRALKINEKALGPDHPDTATSLNNLAFFYNKLGDYARAETLSTRALKIREIALGPDHPDTAGSLITLAALYVSLGDYARAEPLYSRALKIIEKALGLDHPDTAASLNNQAMLYLDMSDYARAEPLFTRALRIYQKALGPDHPDTATSLNNLAMLYHKMGDYVRAEPLYNRALKIYEKALGRDHPNTAISLSRLGMLYDKLGDYSRAEPLLTRALKINEKALGPDHPYTALSRSNLGYLHLAQQQPQLALPQFERAFQIELKHFQATSAIQSERQQREFVEQFRINGYLQALLAAQVPVTDHYARMLLRKGLVFRRQQALRSVRDNPQLQPFFTDWQRTLTQLSQAALKTPANDQERERLQTRVQELTARKEQLEAQLAKESQEFAAAQRFTTVAELQAVLPKGAVLIDCMVYLHDTPANLEKQTKSIVESRLAAFIIPAQGEIQLIDLGLAKPVQEQLALWLGPGRSDLGKSQSAQAAGQKLRQQLWEPLTKSLPKSSTAEVPLVLLSPDGILNQIPWNALPGAKPGTYILEEAALTIIPVPQMLPGLLNPVTPRKPTGKLLVLGDVDYDQAGKTPTAVPEPTPAVLIAAAPRDASAGKFAKLPGTQGELATLEKLCRETFGAEGLTTLQQQAATKAAVQQAAPEHLYLHLATHGFFAAEKFQKLLEVKPERLLQSEQRPTASINPNLLSGIVLAGANVPQAEDDGILTAEEVLGLELRGVQLTTLSACETGLGTTTSGEGLLGLQRAFQVAGCQTVVASQWSVDDAATRALMERFYQNLWVKKLPKLEALREAQLWMLREGPMHGFGAERGAGKIIKDPAATQASPYYWAPFVLSGDWR